MLRARRGSAVRRAATELVRQGATEVRDGDWVVVRMAGEPGDETLEYLGTLSATWTPRVEEAATMNTREALRAANAEGGFPVHRRDLAGLVEARVSDLLARAAGAMAVADREETRPGACGGPTMRPTVVGLGVLVAALVAVVWAVVTGPTLP